MTRDDARDEALVYLHAKLCFGATRRAMRETVHEGYGAPGQPGYMIERGWITVPGVAYKGKQHRFRVDELVDEMEVEARERFWRHWRAYRRDPSADGYLRLAINQLRAVGVRAGLLPVPSGPVGFEPSDPRQREPVQADLFSM